MMGGIPPIAAGGCRDLTKWFIRFNPLIFCCAVEVKELQKFSTRILQTVRREGKLGMFLL